MFDLSKYKGTDKIRMSDERSDAKLDVPEFIFQPIGTNILVNRISVIFCPPWMMIRFQIDQCQIYQSPLFLAQRGRLNLEVPKGAVCLVAVCPGSCYTEDLLREYGDKIMFDKFRASLTYREAQE